MKKSTIGVYGMGVMGRNLALNLEEKGNRVSLYNRSVRGEEDLMSRFMNQSGEGKRFSPHESPETFIASLEKPRKVLIMVKPGRPVDSVIKQLTPLLEPGDILIDGGNSHFSDTERRFKKLEKVKVHFVGMGISGGEEGARHGPSLMPGTTPETWQELKDLFEPIAARSFEGNPCCRLVGAGGSGHFVKMVHNGIEYADMQLLAEAYDLMKRGMGMSHPEIASQFREWNGGPLKSYLTEITAEILDTTDDDGEPLLEKILDIAGQKGTGKWTAIHAMEDGIPADAVTAAVHTRFISSFKDLRVRIGRKRGGEVNHPINRSKETLNDLADALMASRMLVHAEGFFLITEMSKEKKWGIDPSSVAEGWQGGCIIRSELLKSIVTACGNGDGMSHLLESPLYMNRFRPVEQGWRRTVALAATSRMPVPAMMSALSQFDAWHSETLPANLIQAQRDFFGAHTYERTDSPRGTFFHTDWSSTGKE